MRSRNLVIGTPVMESPHQPAAFHPASSSPAEWGISHPQDFMTPQTHESPFVTRRGGQLFNRYSSSFSFVFNSYEICRHISFEINSCKFIALKTPWNQQLQKNQGGYPLNSAVNVYSQVTPYSISSGSAPRRFTAPPMETGKRCADRQSTFHLTMPGDT